MNSDNKKIPALICYVVALACFFLPFMQISCQEMNLEVSGYAMATGTVGDSIAKDLGKKSPMGSLGMPPGGQQDDMQSIELLLAMVALGIGLFIGLNASSGTIKTAAGLGAVAAILTIVSIPKVKPGMEGMMEVSLRIGFYGILVGSLAGCVLHWMRLKTIDKETS